MGPDPPGWGFSVGFKTQPPKKLSVRKPEMWPRERMKTGRSSQGIEGYGGGPVWRQRPALGCSANEEEKVLYCHFSLRVGW